MPNAFRETVRRVILATWIRPISRVQTESRRCPVAALSLRGGLKLPAQAAPVAASATARDRLLVLYPYPAQIALERDRQLRIEVLERADGLEGGARPRAPV